MTRRVIGVCAVGLLSGLVACSENSPTAPTPPTAPISRAPTPTNIVLSATPDALPSAGGSADVRVRVIARNTPQGDVGVSGVLVKLSSTEGALDAAELTTNDAGEGTVRWSTTKTGTIVARAGVIDANLTIPVAIDVSPPTPPRIPTPPPAPTPIPPTPEPPPPTDMAVTLTASPSSVTLGQSVTFTATAAPPAGAGVIRHFEWDYGDGVTLTTGESVTTHTYAATGSYRARVTARTTTWANGTGSASVTVSPVPPPPPPTLRVTLSADNTTVTEGSTVTFTATPDGFLPGESIIAYQWDLDGNGTFEVTTTTNTRPHTYATSNLYTAKVKITTSGDRTAEGTRRITVTP